LIVSLAGGKIPKGVAGPVGVTAIVSEAAKIGFLPFLQFMALISVNLAVLNLVPFPPLDGFRIFMIGVEGFFGKKLLPKVEQYIQIGGMAILVGLLVLLTLNDIPNIIRAGGLVVC
jgi:regulator of sigma E protease